MSDSDNEQSTISLNDLALYKFFLVRLQNLNKIFIQSLISKVFISTINAEKDWRKEPETGRKDCSRQASVTKRSVSNLLNFLWKPSTKLFLIVCTKPSFQQITFSMRISTTPGFDPLQWIPPMDQQTYKWIWCWGALIRSMMWRWNSARKSPSGVFSAQPGFMELCYLCFYCLDNNGTMTDWDLETKSVPTWKVLKRSIVKAEFIINT